MKIISENYRDVDAAAYERVTRQMMDGAARRYSVMRVEHALILELGGRAAYALVSELVTELISE